LRGRLSLAYASALIVALAIFALIALAVVDGAQRRALDEQLESTARALRIVGDIRGGRLSVDAGDRRQFNTIVSAKTDSAIVLSDGAVAISTDERTARALLSAAPHANAPHYATLTVATERLRVYVSPISATGVRVGETVTWGDAGAITALDRSVAFGFALAIPLIAGLAIFAGSEIARRGLAPLDRIAALASEIEAQDLSRRLRLPARNDELGRLGATFDRMLDRLQGAFDRERRFTSDASHELRAPLSVIRAEADLALRRERTPAEYRRALETIAAESDALEALTRDLLAAARNASSARDVRGPVDLTLVASTVAQRLSVVAGARRVRVEEAAGGDAIVQGNRALIERAIVSVLDNALKYSSDAGTVEIRISRESPQAELTVRDDGPGFSPEALQRGFDRFWRDDDARARDGSGLGLSLAKTIVEHYGGTIVLGNAEPHGAIVRMTFPSVVG
jgi:signal transduction histidine kinase